MIFEVLIERQYCCLSFVWFVVFGNVLDFFWLMYHSILVLPLQSFERVCLSLRTDLSTASHCRAGLGVMHSLILFLSWEVFLPSSIMTDSFARNIRQGQYVCTLRAGKIGVQVFLAFVTWIEKSTVIIMDLSLFLFF